MKKEIKTFIENYPSKYEYGFLETEIEEILGHYPEINMDKFENALMGNTCMMIEGKIIQYHCDIVKAIVCGMENRDLTEEEWD
jgi:hypothetical protein